METPGAQHSVDPNAGTAMCTCLTCNTQLSYPVTAEMIACPNCHQTQDPRIVYVNCAGCNTLLSHPRTTTSIQCPKCQTLMDVSRTAPPTGALGAPGSAPTPLVQIPMGLQSQLPYSAHPYNALPNLPPLPPSSGTTKIKRKDPLAPKRASNAYMVFCKSYRPRLKQERPDLAFGQLGKTLGNMWRLMTQEEKAPYEERAIAERERYKEKLKHYELESNKKKAENDAKKQDPTAIGAAGAGGLTSPLTPSGIPTNNPPLGPDGLPIPVYHPPPGLPGGPPLSGTLGADGVSNAHTLGGTDSGTHVKSEGAVTGGVIGSENGTSSLNAIQTVGQSEVVKQNGDEEDDDEDDEDDDDEDDDDGEDEPTSSKKRKTSQT